MFPLAGDASPVATALYAQKLASTERLVKLASTGNMAIARREAMMKPVRWRYGDAGRLIFETAAPPPELVSTLTSNSALPAHLAKLVECIHGSAASENADVLRECQTLRKHVHAGNISVEQYLSGFGGFVAIGPGYTTTPADAPAAEAEVVSGRLNGLGSLPPIVFTIDNAVVLADGKTATDKLSENAVVLAAVDLKRLLMGNVERPAIDSLLQGTSSPSKLTRGALNFTQEYNDARVKVQLRRRHCGPGGMMSKIVPFP